MLSLKKYIKLKLKEHANKQIYTRQGTVRSTKQNKKKHENYEQKSKQKPCIHCTDYWNQKESQTLEN